MTISAQLRDAIRNSGETHYRIGKDTGVDISIVDRFVSGERPFLRSDTIDKLCEYLSLELCRKDDQTAPKQPANKRRTTGKERRK